MPSNSCCSRDLSAAAVFMRLLGGGSTVAMIIQIFKDTGNHSRETEIKKVRDGPCWYPQPYPLA